MAQHSFAMTPSANIQRSSFDRSHGHKLTMDADYVVPVFVDEALPGDTMNMKARIFARMATPIYPLMDNLYLDTFWFAVPYRLVWENWHKFLGAQDDPGDSIDYTIPTMQAPGAGYAVNSLHDYMGLPPGVADFQHSSLLLRSYNLIWNEWFRDENLQDSITVDKDDGPDNQVNYVIKKRGKRHDYFTSCLPWPQKSDTGVSLPLGTSAPVLGIGINNPSSTASYSTKFSDDTTSSIDGWQSVDGSPAAGETRVIIEEGTTGFPNIYADLSSATAATINAIRLAVTTQQFLERDARGGTRINEIILSHFGVMSPDSRVQRPEYLGGSSKRIDINSVPQTSESNTTPQGTLSAFGTVFEDYTGFMKSFSEHCLILGLAMVRADITYQQGLERMWSRSTRYDFYWPTFANLGEQAVLQQEIEVTDPAAGTNDDVFGYQERWAEYRYKPSRISGLYRSAAAGTLDPWHLSEDLSSPALNATFIESNTPMTRVKAVTSEPDFLVDCHFNYKSVRPMPVHSVPGLVRF